MTVTVEFEGDRWDVAPDQDFTFGRAGDLCVDEANLYMHRVIGLLRHRDRIWWLHNVGEWSELEIHTEKGSSHTMAPNTRLAVVTACDVKFRAGKAKSMIRVTPRNPPRSTEPIRVIVEAPSTNRFGVVTLNDDQRLLLAALCEQSLGSQSAQNPLPSNQAVANRLGWTITKFNRKLDYLCRRLTREGVPGLQGGRGQRARARREHLVAHVISTGLITHTDLDLLD